MVLLIIVLLMGVSAVAIESAFTEQKVRDDSRQLELMVRTAMLQSEEQHRPYAIDLTATTMALHPVEDAVPDDAATDGAPKSDSPDDVQVVSHLTTPNQLLMPDPEKANVWIAMQPTTWVFEPGELCPAPRVRLARGDAWVEMSFNALTGNVEDEAAYFP